ncbi:hypothetical protein KKP91_01700 [Methanothermococcus sp. SCGC AD-155-M21]|nr:hypothetical protein [Methanothermococcus sp. SCGC AD-155-M21]
MNVNIDSKLRPLYANLLRLSIDKYLISKRFNYLCIEYNIDQLWGRCEEYIWNLRRANMVIPVYTDYAEEALGVFLTELFRKDQSLFISVLSKIIIDFADWDRETKDFSKVIESLFNLGYTEDDLEEILARMKKREN